jgi:hypothetical protein
VTYQDRAPVRSISALSSVSVSRAGVMRASSSRVAAGGSIVVTVTDADLDMDEALADSTDIKVQGMRSEAASIKVVETGPTTGVFTGTVEAREWGECSIDTWGCSAASMSSATDSSVYVTPGEVVTLNYVDQAPSRSVALALRTCTLARVEVHPLIIAVGWDVAMTIEDPDKSGANNVTVVVRGDADEELMTLYERIDTPGVFGGELRTSLQASHAPKNSGALYLSKKSIIQVQYSDPCPAQSVQASLTATIVGIITLSSSELQKGARLGITVVDAQMNSPGGTSVDTIGVTCRGTSGDTQIITLTETGPDNGVFTGICSPGDGGSLTGDVGLDVLCTHTSVSPPMLLQAATRIVASNAGSVSLAPTNAPAGSNMFVTVTDADLNVNKAGVDQYTSLVRLRSGQFEMRVSVRETGPNTDVFTAMVQAYDTSFTSQAPQAGMLPMTDGVPLTAYYQEDAPYTERVAQVSVRRSNVAEITITNPIGASGRARVLVADADLNRNTNAVETSTVQVAVNSPGSSPGTICAANGKCP